MIKLRHLLSEIYIDGFTSSDEKQGFRRPENFDDYAEGSGWIAYRGGNDWENGTTACAVYFNAKEEQARIWFTVKVPKGMTPDSDCPKEKQKEWNEWGEKASKKWISIAKKIHSVPKEYFKDGKPWYKDWKTCFIEALKKRDMKKYVKEWGVDHTTWKAMKKSEPEPATQQPNKPLAQDEPEKKQAVNEGSSVPGALEGWLDTSGTCWYVEDTHAEWAARYLKEPPPDETDVGAYEHRRMVLMRQLFDKGWVRIIIQHGNDLLYFDTFDKPWKQLTRSQKSWLYSAAIHGVGIQGDKIEVKSDDFRVPPYKLQFGGGKGNGYIEVGDMREVKV